MWQGCVCVNRKDGLPMLIHTLFPILDKFGKNIPDLQKGRRLCLVSLLWHVLHSNTFPVAPNKRMLSRQNFNMHRANFHIIIDHITDHRVKGNELCGRNFNLSFPSRMVYSAVSRWDGHLDTSPYYLCWTKNAMSPAHINYCYTNLPSIILFSNPCKLSVFTKFG